MEQDAAMPEQSHDMFKALLAVSQREMHPDTGEAASVSGDVNSGIQIGMAPWSEEEQSRSMYREVEVSPTAKVITCAMKIKLLLRTRNPKLWMLPLRGVYLRLVQVFPGARRLANEIHRFYTGASRRCCCFQRLASSALWQPAQRTLACVPPLPLNPAEDFAPGDMALVAVRLDTDLLDLQAGPTARLAIQILTVDPRNLDAS